MRIGTDIDGVLGDWYGGFLPWLRTHRGKEYQYDAMRDHDLTKNFGWTEEEVHETLTAFQTSPEFERIRPIDLAPVSIALLAKEGHEIVAITSRSDRVRERTHRFLDRYFPAIDEVHFSSDLTKNGAMTKAEICQALGVDIMVEDAPNYAADIARNTPVILYHQPWNADYAVPGVHRVRDWIAAYVRILHHAGAGRHLLP
jgi:uncharacterized HAD superfamily protein